MEPTIYKPSIYKGAGIYKAGAEGGGSGGGIPYLKNIAPVNGVKVVDENGYIGGAFYSGVTYYTAIVVPNADYSGEGLGRVIFVSSETIGGREYNVVTIGGVTWLAENLDFKFSGVAIGESGKPETPAAWYYDNDEATYGVNGNKYGLLYNWYAVKLLNDNKAELCPGWHVSTLAEWNDLTSAVGGYSTAGTKLKSTIGWSSGNGNDDFGFAVFPAGYRGGADSFYNLGRYANFWTATQDSSEFANLCNFGADEEIHFTIHHKTDAYSVRLVKDS